MSTLVKSARRRFGKTAARGIARFFNALSLPVPAAGEFRIASRREGYLVYLNDYGCVIRMTNERLYPRIRHPRILQSIVTRKAGRLRISLNPGIVCPVTQRDAEVLDVKLWRDNIELQDGHRYNVGRLPAIPGLTPPNYTVVIDEGAVQKMDGAKDIKEPSPQDALYEPLRQAFKRACTKANGTPDRKKIAAFWKTISRAKNNGWLVAGWERPRQQSQWTDYNNFDTGENYAARCRAAIRRP